jgi:hypothetical protein
MKQESERGGGGREGGQQWLWSKPSNHLKIYVSERGGSTPRSEWRLKRGVTGIDEYRQLGFQIWSRPIPHLFVESILFALINPCGKSSSSLNWVDDGMYQSTVVFRPDVRSDKSRCGMFKLLDAHVHGLVMLILVALIFRDMMSSS